MRIFLSGASGNVGRAIIRNIQKERDLELAGGRCREAGQDIEDHTSDVYMDGIFLTVSKMPHMAPGTFVRDLAEIRRVR